VYWELTQACDLACRHCRAEAQPARDARELTTAEGCRLLEALRGFGPTGAPVILTGGDPFRRPDFWTLLEHGAALGLDLAIAPSATPLLTAQAIQRLAATGARAISLSVDGSTAERHDGLRGVAGCFARTLAGARAARAAGLALQVNTLVAAETAEDLGAIGELAAALGATRWSLFALVPVGRGRVLRPLAPGAFEGLLERVWTLGRTLPLAVTTTEAPHYRRVVLQRMRAEGWSGEAIRRHPVRHSFGVRDGHGIMFVSHRGDVTPSGFLPLAVGNVRRTSPVELYRDAPVFRRLRRPDTFGGRCGRCEFRVICGGSRARAYAATGDPFGEDPLCAYQPGARRPAAAG
jgi:radical SAM protein